MTTDKLIIYYGFPVVLQFDAVLLRSHCDLDLE